MKSIYNFIIETNSRYNNEVDVEGKELIVNTEITERDYEFVNRTGVVKATPLAYDTPIDVGDEVIVHHNVFRRWYDIRGKEKDSTNLLTDNEFFVYHDQLFGYKKDGVWKGTPGSCFVKPISRTDKWGMTGNIELVGTMEFTDIHIDSLGIKQGDIIGFTPNSEYVFEIEGELLYRVFSNQINVLYGSKEETDLEAIGS